MAIARFTYALRLVWALMPFGKTTMSLLVQLHRMVVGSKQQTAQIASGAS